MIDLMRLDKTIVSVVFSRIVRIFEIYYMFIQRMYSSLTVASSQIKIASMDDDAQSSNCSFSQASVPIDSNAKECSVSCKQDRGNDQDNNIHPEASNTTLQAMYDFLF